jgi:hypothetical protein
MPHRNASIVFLALFLVAIALGAVSAEALARQQVRSHARAQITRLLGHAGCAHAAARIHPAGLVLPQLVRGALDRLTIDIDDLKANGVTTDFALTLRDVQVPHGGARHADLVSTTSWASLMAELRSTDQLAATTDARFVGVRDGDALVQLEVPLPFGAVPATARVSFAVAGDGVVGAVKDITVAGVPLSGSQVDAGSGGGYLSSLDRRRPVPLPSGMRLTSVSAQQTGLVIRASGSLAENARIEHLTCSTK